MTIQIPLDSDDVDIAVTVVDPLASLVVSSFSEPAPSIGAPAGPQGPMGASPLVSVYNAQSPVTSSGGVLTLDCTAATTFMVSMTEHISSIVFQHAPASNKSQRISVYFMQDSLGSRTLAPSSVRAPDAAALNLSSAAYAIDLVIFDLVEGYIFATVAATNYLPLT